MVDKQIHTPNDDKLNCPSVDFNWWLKSLDNTSLELTNQNSNQMNKHGYKNFGYKRSFPSQPDH